MSEKCEKCIQWKVDNTLTFNHIEAFIWNVFTITNYITCCSIYIFFK